MKLAILLESAKQGDINKLVYDLVLKHIKTDKATLADIKHNMDSTDQFWTDELDNVAKELNRSIDDGAEAIFQALEDVGNQITDHYSNAWNHEPGYKKPSTLSFDSEDVTFEEVMQGIEKLMPELFKAHTERVATAKKESVDKHKALIKSVQPLIPHLADAIAKVYAKAWNNTLEYYKKHLNDPLIKSLIANEYQIKDLKAFKSGVEFANHIRATGSERDLRELTYEMLLNVARPLSDEEEHLLSTVRSHTATSKKLWAMISRRIPKA